MAVLIDMKLFDSIDIDIRISIVELTEFPKIDISDDDDDDDDDGGDDSDINSVKKRIQHGDDDDRLSNSISSLSIDSSSLNTTNNQSGMSTRQTTSDYESFADCLRQSPTITSVAAATAAALPTKSLTHIHFDHQFSTQTSVRVNGEGSASFDLYQRQRKHGTSSIKNKPTGGLSNNETPLLSHLIGTSQHECDSTSNSLSIH
jgi:hypothetical protein